MRLKDVFLRKVIAICTALAHQVMEEPAREAGGATTAMKIYYVADRVPWPREKMGQDKSAQRTQD